MDVARSTEIIFGYVANKCHEDDGKFYIRPNASRRDLELGSRYGLSPMLTALLPVLTSLLPSKSTVAVW